VWFKKKRGNPNVNHSTRGSNSHTLRTTTRFVSPIFPVCARGKKTQQNLVPTEKFRFQLVARHPVSVGNLACLESLKYDDASVENMLSVHDFFFGHFADMCSWPLIFIPFLFFLYLPWTQRTERPNLGHMAHHYTFLAVRDISVGN
jgi:hypothetical protein